MRTLPTPTLSLTCSLAIWLTSAVSCLAASRPCETCSHCRHPSAACDQDTTQKSTCPKCLTEKSTCAICSSAKSLCQTCEKCCGEETAYENGEDSASHQFARAPSATASTNSTKKANSQYTVMLTCPAEARVTIDGKMTYASGTNRLYQLEFAGETHNCRLEMWLRDNEEQATYTFDHDIGCQNGKRLALSVTRRQMTKEPDKHWTDEIAKRLKPTNVMVIMDDGKIEVKSKDEYERAIANSSPPKSPATSSAEPAAPQTNLERQIDQLKDRIIGWESDRKKLNSELTTKTKHLEAVVKTRRQTEDALLLKQHEVNAAVNNAPVLEARRLDAKKLELELNRAHEQENEARTSVQQTQHVANDLDGRIEKGKQALAHLWLLESVEKQTQIVNTAKAEVQQLDDGLRIQEQRVTALAAVEEAQRNSSNIAILRDILASAKADYAATQKKRVEAQRRAQQAEEKLGQIRAGSPPDERP